MTMKNSHPLNLDTRRLLGFKLLGKNITKSAAKVGTKLTQGSKPPKTARNTHGAALLGAKVGKISDSD